MQSSNHLYSSNAGQSIDYYSNNVQFILTNDVNPSLGTDTLGNLTIDPNALTYMANVPLQLVPDTNHSGSSLILEAPTSLHQPLALDSFQLEVLPSGHLVLAPRTPQISHPVQQVIAIQSLDQGPSQNKPTINQTATFKQPSKPCTNQLTEGHCLNKTDQSVRPREVKLKRTRQRLNKILNLEFTRKTNAVNAKRLPKSKAVQESNNGNLDSEKAVTNVRKPSTHKQRNKTSVSETQTSHSTTSREESNEFKVPEVTRKRTIPKRNAKDVGNKSTNESPVKKQRVNFLQETISRLSREQSHNVDKKEARSGLSQELGIDTINSSKQKVDSSRGQSCRVYEQRVEVFNDGQISQEQNEKPKETKNHLFNQSNETRAEPSREIESEPIDSEVLSEKDPVENAAHRKPKIPPEGKFAERTLLSKKFRILSADHRSWSQPETSNEQTTTTIEPGFQPLVRLGKGEVSSKTIVLSDKIQISNGQIYKLENNAELVLIDDNNYNAFLERTVYNEQVDETAESFVPEQYIIEENVEIVNVNEEHVNETHGAEFYNKKSDKIDGPDNANSTLLDEDLILPPSKDKFRYKCSKCPRAFKLSFQLKKHLYQHLSNDKKYKCSFCDERFNHKANLELHELLHSLETSDSTASGRGSCPVCATSFSRVASLKCHVVTHMRFDDLTCVKCGDEFRTEYSLELHSLEHASQEAKSGSTEGDRKDPSLSDEPRVPLSALEKENCNKQLICKVCKTYMSCKEEMKDHWKYHKKVKSLARPGRKMRKGLALKSKHHGRVCNTCHKSFTRPSQLIRHLRIHTGEKPYKCTQCSKAFNQKNSLELHMLKHTGLRPHECKICHTTFSQAGNLRGHVQRVHKAPWIENQELFPCTHCPSLFHRRSLLTMHVARVHKSVTTPPALMSGSLPHPPSKDKPGRTSLPTPLVIPEEELPQEKEDSEVIENGGLSCSYCSLSFKTRASLSRHIRCHRKPYACTGCDKTFSTRQRLECHYNSIHERTKFYMCNLCEPPQPFSTLPGLRKHENFSHQSHSVYNADKLSDAEYPCCNNINPASNQNAKENAESKALEMGSKAQIESSVCLLDNTKYTTASNDIGFTNPDTNNSGVDSNSCTTSTNYNQTNLIASVQSTNSMFVSNAQPTNSSVGYLTLSANYTSPSFTKTNVSTSFAPVGFTTLAGNYIPSVLATSNGYVNLVDADSAAYLNQILAAINRDALLINEGNESVILVMQPEEQVNDISNVPTPQHPCNPEVKIPQYFQSQPIPSDIKERSSVIHKTRRKRPSVGTQETECVSYSGNPGIDNTADISAGNLLENSQGKVLGSRTQLSEKHVSGIAARKSSQENGRLTKSGGHSFVYVKQSSSVVSSYEHSGSDQTVSYSEQEHPLEPSDSVPPSDSNSTEPASSIPGDRGVGIEATAGDSQEGHFEESDKILLNEQGEIIGVYQDYSALRKVLDNMLGGRTQDDVKDPTHLDVRRLSDGRKKLSSFEQTSATGVVSSDGELKTPTVEKSPSLSSNPCIGTRSVPFKIPSTELSSHQAQNSQLLGLNPRDKQTEDSSTFNIPRKQQDNLHHHSSIYDGTRPVSTCEIPVDSSNMLNMKVPPQISMKTCKTSNSAGETSELLNSTQISTLNLASTQFTSATSTQLNSSQNTTQMNTTQISTQINITQMSSQVIRTVLNDGTIVTPASQLVAVPTQVATNLVATQPVVAAGTQCTAGLPQFPVQQTLRQSSVHSSQHSRPVPYNSSQVLCQPIRQSVVTAKLVPRCNNTPLENTIPNDDTSNNALSDSVTSSSQPPETSLHASDTSIQSRIVRRRAASGKSSEVVSQFTKSSENIKDERTEETLDDVEHATVATRYNAIYYKCPFSSCDRILTSDFDMNAHLRTHLSQAQQNSDIVVHFKCDRCESIFRSEQELVTHKLSHEKYSCTTCTRVFSNEAEKKIHFMREHCDEFIKNSSTASDVQKSEPTEPPELKPVSCYTCGVFFSNHQLLNLHITESHAKPDVAKPKNPRTKTNLLKTLNQEEIAQLLLRDSNPETLSEKTLVEVTREKLNPPIVMVSSNALNIPPEQHANKCRLCPKSFKKPSDLVRHIRVHTKEKPFMCSVCEARFANKSSLVVHEKSSHTRENRFTCHLCKRDFYCSSSLKVHMRLHSGSKPFICPVQDCGKTFRTSGHRTVHLQNNHRDDLVFTWTPPDSGVKDLQLKKAKQGRSDDSLSPQKCQLCGKNLSDLTRHWHCAECPKVFVSERGVETHMCGRATNQCSGDERNESGDEKKTIVGHLSGETKPSGECGDESNEQDSLLGKGQHVESNVRFRGQTVNSRDHVHFRRQGGHSKEDSGQSSEDPHSDRQNFVHLVGQRTYPKKESVHLSGHSTQDAHLSKSERSNVHSSGQMFNIVSNRGVSQSSDFLIDLQIQSNLDKWG